MSARTVSIAILDDYQDAAARYFPEDELKRQGFGGHISIEYETNWDDNVPDASQNVGFIRGWAAARGH
jgi:hypothetical protein